MKEQLFKENSFVYKQLPTEFIAIISYNWYTSYDNEKQEATFYYKDGVPYKIKIDREELNNYIYK